MSWLWSNILIKSSLAAAIRDVYDSISNNQIASVEFASNPPLDLQLQIPVPSFLLSLPTSVERSMPGLLVTTADPLMDEEGNVDPNFLNKHFALLLLDDEEKIINQIQNDDVELSAPLLECIRLCKPSLSFLQVAQANSIELGSLLMLSQHLIYWRKALAIPPLHPRETYIVSPNADHHKLVTAKEAWKKKFPYAPTLNNFLARLAAAPRPFKTFFPSKNHRESYLEMLGWLIRGGWVTQLHTFACILIWPEIIYEVEYQIQADAIARRAKDSTPKHTSSESAASTEESGSEKGKEKDPSAPLTTEQAAEHARLDRLAAKEVADHIAEAAEFAKKPRPVVTDHPSFNNAQHLKHLSPYVINDPHKVSQIESMYIAALANRFTDSRVRDAFFKYSKYFNGQESLEMSALREGVKRKETWAMLMNFSEHLIVIKHW